MQIPKKLEHGMREYKTGEGWRYARCRHTNAHSPNKFQP